MSRHRPPLPPAPAPLVHTLATPHHVLRTVAKPVKTFDKALATLLTQMGRTLLAYGGVGLAAPQIGVSQQVMLVAPPGDTALVAVNPVLLRVSKKESRAIEGCLSLPDLWGMGVPRPDMVLLHYQDAQGRGHRVRLTGTAARVAQHELDHLYGRLFIDRINPQAVVNTATMLRLTGQDTDPLPDPVLEAARVLSRP